MNFAYAPLNEFRKVPVAFLFRARVCAMCTGALPLIGCVLSTTVASSRGIAQSDSASFALSIAITGTTLFFLGAIKSQVMG